MVAKKNTEAAAAKAKNVAKKKNTAATKKRAGAVKDFLNGVKSELKKVHWPTRRETMVYTGVVLATVTFVAALIWVLDSILNGGLSLIIR